MKPYLTAKEYIKLVARLREGSVDDALTFIALLVSAIREVCPACKGSGRDYDCPSYRKNKHGYDYCQVCVGSGWVRREAKIQPPVE